jgi:hypothetical protein
MILFSAGCIVADGGAARLAAQGCCRRTMLAVLWNSDTDGCRLALLLHTVHLASGSEKARSSPPPS